MKEIDIYKSLKLFSDFCKGDYINTVSYTTNLEIPKNFSAKLMGLCNMYSLIYNKLPNVIILNIKHATLVQDSEYFAFAPMGNPSQYKTGAPYFLGSLCSVRLIVDPMLCYEHNYVSVGHISPDDNGEINLDNEFDELPLSSQIEFKHEDKTVYMIHELSEDRSELIKVLHPVFATEELANEELKHIDCEDNHVLVVIEHPLKEEYVEV